MNWDKPNSKRVVKKVLNNDPNQNNNILKGLFRNRKTIHSCFK
jgi:hypothetical protein